MTCLIDSATSYEKGFTIEVNSIDEAFEYVRNYDNVQHLCDESYGWVKSSYDFAHCTFIVDFDVQGADFEIMIYDFYRE